jgi:hypothetical protein
MRILLDECVPRALKRHLPHHEAQTVPEAVVPTQSPMSVIEAVRA